MISIHKKKSTIGHAALIETLVGQGYRRVEMVLEVGDIAVRGSIIDIFGYRHSHPTRIDYFGDQIDRLNSFDVHTQCSLTDLKNVTFHEKPHDYDIRFQRLGKRGDEGGYDHERISQFQEGDYIVHEQYGIGRFIGLVRLTHQAYEGEFVQLNYKGSDILYVPLDQLQLIHAYSGPETPKVNRLHDTTWKKTKQKAQRTTKEMAESIYLLHQMRQSINGFAFCEDTEDQISFESEFKYPLTADQETAVNTIKAQMEAPYPMDMVVCGDVGFGKTEVLLRAAFKALENMKQVAILVPTTILCAQHVKTITQRLVNYGYIVGELSRFKTQEDQKDVIKKLKHQQVDIVVGTHRLLSKAIQFKDLGLLIIDEEQRFGVSHKEWIKTQYASVDIITASATPIPRTLYMSLTGAKSCVQINTPPPNRRPISTHVGPYNDHRIKRAVEHELKQGGQVYYVYNSVQFMKQKLQHLRQLLPSYQIEMAHGQLSETKLQSIMMDFYSQKIDILVCSTIIENGMDITNVNTIIIDGVQRLGVSQIHQLRGRVGRSQRQGYAYLLYDNAVTLSELSRKRLQKIKEYTALGSGYQLAKSDLVNRGAGQLFGKEQSGHIQAVGFQLYCQLIEQTLHQIQGKALPKSISLELNPQKIMIPVEYIKNPRERLALYMRFLTLKSQKALNQLIQEMLDRYGPMSQPIKECINYIKRQLKYQEN